MWLIEISSGKPKFMPDNSYNNLPAKVKAKYAPRDKADIEAISLEAPAVTKFEFSKTAPETCEHKAIIEDLQKQLEESIIKFTDSQAELTTEKELNKEYQTKIRELNDKLNSGVKESIEIKSEQIAVKTKNKGGRPKSKQ